MLIKCNVDLATVEPEDQFTITNQDGVDLQCEMSDNGTDVFVMMDLFIEGDIDTLTMEVASMAKDASFMTQLGVDMIANKQEVLTDKEDLSGGGEDPYLVIILGHRIPAKHSRRI